MAKTIQQIKPVGNQPEQKPAITLEEIMAAYDFIRQCFKICGREADFLGEFGSRDKYLKQFKEA